MKFITTIVLIILVCACSTTPPPPELIATIGEEETILRVSAKNGKFTSYYPDDKCIEELECIPYSYWYRYKARVKEVVKGTYNQKHVTFVLLQHTNYSSENWYVRLGKFTNEKTIEQLETGYFIIDHGVEYNEEQNAFQN